MPPYTIEQIKNEVSQASEEYNATAPLGGEDCKCVSVRQLCGRAGDSQIRYRPARAVYFGRREFVYLGSSAVLHGGALGRLGGRGARPRLRRFASGCQQGGAAL